MATEEIEDAEGDLIRSVREIIGTLPIVVTLDLHANITAEMAEYSDTIIGFDTYPHVDCYDRGVEAGQVIFDIVQGRDPADNGVSPTAAADFAAGAMYDETLDERDSGTLARS